MTRYVPTALLLAGCLTALATAEIVAVQPVCCGKDQQLTNVMPTHETQAPAPIIVDDSTRPMAEQIRHDDVKKCGCTACTGATCSSASRCSSTCGPCCSSGCSSSNGIGFGSLFGHRGGLCSGTSCCQCMRCCPGWTAVGEVLFLSRTDAEDYALITDQNSSVELLNVGDFDFNYNGAPRLLLRYETADCIGFELGYIGLDSWNDAETRGVISPTLMSPGVAIPSSAPGTMFNAAYGSEFHSGEVNVRKRCNQCLTWVLGFRMIDFSDTLATQTIAPTVRDMFTIDADNHMYGFQLGFDSELINCTEQFHIDSIFRVGVLFNDADQTTNAPVFDGLPANTIASNVGASDNHTTFLGELGLRAVYELSNCISVGSGYHLIFLEGLALAPDQLAASSLAGAGSASLDTGGGILIHGASINATVRF
ncbi:MAG: BBP7 family outer membrane beta-barrel protein [Planctomycetales bacterium]|nr:BBP7 family outer membrane beta-barrel protein [Planctomycetales bacterium]